MNSKTFAFFLGVFLSVPLSNFGQQIKKEPSYKVENAQKINSEVYQLVFNPTDKKVYVAGLRSGFNRNVENYVHILDGTTLAVVDSINVGKNLPFGIALNNRTQTLYIGYSVQNSICAIDLGTRKQTIIPAGHEKGKIREIVVDEDRNLVYVSDHGHHAVWVVDGATNTYKQALVYPDAYLIGLNIDPVRRKIYATDGQNMKGHVLVFDADKNELADLYKTWSYCPMNIAVDYKKNRLFVSQSTDNNVTVLDGHTGEIIDKIHLGLDASPIGLVYDEKQEVVYTANRKSKDVAVIDMKAYKVLERVPTGGLPNTISLDRENGNIYVTNKSPREPDKTLVNTNAVVRIRKVNKAE